MLTSSERPLRAGVVLVCLALAGSLARDAAAHIDLKQPPPRELGSSIEPNSNLKQGPCGQVVDGRTDTVSVFSPGETIDVEWQETVNHRSYYRIAFDRDGDDAFPTFAGPGRGTQGIDPNELCPVDGQVILAYAEDSADRNHTLRVTLPDVECERCTLQVVQYMFDTNRPYYFQCADLALRRDTAADAGAPNDALDASVSDASAAAEPSAAPGCNARIAPPLDAGTSAPDRDIAGAGGTASAPTRAPGMPNANAGAAGEPAGGTDEPVASTSHDDGGCALRPAPSERAPIGVLAMLVGSVWYRYRTGTRAARRRATLPSTSA